MNKWKYEKEITRATTILLNAYLITKASETITIVFEHDNFIYAYDLTNEDVNDLARVNGNKLLSQSLGKKRKEKYLKNAIVFAHVSDIEYIKEQFPEYANNNGYISEFIYRYKKTGETIEQIKKSNKSIGYDIAPDTMDGKQIKNIDSGATFTTFDYLIKVVAKKAPALLENVKKSIEFLQTIYQK